MTRNIACLVRGGEAGRKVQERAIACALENNLNIVFLHVVDLSLANGETEALADAMRQELAWLGKVTLNMARRRAKMAGVKAEGVLLYGTVLEAAQNYLSNHPPERVLIGAPHPDAANYDSRLQRVLQFARRLEESIGAPVEVVSD